MSVNGFWGAAQYSGNYSGNVSERPPDTACLPLQVLPADGALDFGRSQCSVRHGRWVCTHRLTWCRDPGHPDNTLIKSDHFFFSKVKYALLEAGLHGEQALHEGEAAGQGGAAPGCASGRRLLTSRGALSRSPRPAHCAQRRSPKCGAGSGEPRDRGCWWLVTVETGSVVCV